MTEQENAALVGLCRIEIKRWKAASESNPNMHYMVELMEIALAALTTPPASAIPDGWRLVPVELTPDMQNAWDNAPNCNNDDDSVNISNAYRAMISAAPNP